jgi:hypothetical protein
MRTLKIFFHDGCFDGVSSAATFARFYRDAIDAATAIVPVGMAHRDGDPFAEVAFDADAHACVDFRFSPNAAMHWWFDHHATAFQPAALRQVFDERRNDNHIFDPLAPSCAGLITRSLSARGWQPPSHLLEVTTWADRIDALDYDSAAAAVSMTAPAQRIALFLSTATSPETAELALRLAERSLDEVAADPRIQRAAALALTERDHTLAELRAAAVSHGEVIEIDLLDRPGRRAPGLLGYLLFPTCRYVVSAVAGPTAVRISVGHNPWIGTSPTHHIGELCQRYGGGGHAAVGGVTLGPDEVDRGRTVVRALTRALAE